MSRLLPKSLFGQTLLILLAGLILSHAVGSWIYTMDREQAVRAVGGFAAAQRIANLTRLVQETPPERRERMVAALSDQSFRVSVSAQPPVTTSGMMTRRSHWRSRIFSSISCHSRPPGSPASPPPGRMARRSEAGTR
jgi:hypothetical protein